MPCLGRYTSLDLPTAARPWKSGGFPFCPTFYPVVIPLLIPLAFFLVACGVCSDRSNYSLPCLSRYSASADRACKLASLCRHHCDPRPHSWLVCSYGVPLANTDHSPLCSPSTRSPSNDDSKHPQLAPATSHHQTSLLSDRDSRRRQTCWPRVLRYQMLSS